MEFQIETLTWTRFLITQSDRKVVDSAQDVAKNRRESTYHSGGW